MWLLADSLYFVLNHKAKLWPIICYNSDMTPACQSVVIQLQKLDCYVLHYGTGISISHSEPFACEMSFFVCFSPTAFEKHPCLFKPP